MLKSLKVLKYPYATNLMTEELLFKKQQLKG